jgi:TM2 domain-containing membrane protein YozV
MSYPQPPSEPTSGGPSFEKQPPPQNGAPYGQQAYPPPPPGPYVAGQPLPGAPYGVDPLGRPYSDKSKIVAGVLQLFLGCFGIGRFYTGHTGMAIAQLLTCGGLGVWALIDAIILLVSNDKTDAKGYVLRG